MSAEHKSVEITETYTSDGIPTIGAKAGTAEDREAMRRLGKQQLFKVWRLTRTSASEQVLSVTSSAISASFPFLASR